MDVRSWTSKTNAFWLLIVRSVLSVSFRCSLQPEGSKNIRPGGGHYGQCGDLIVSIRAGKGESTVRARGVIAGERFVLRYIPLTSIAFYSQATLYSVRWYFEGEEFYRFVPKESPPARTFPVSGITVDVSSEWAFCFVILFYKRSNQR